MINWRKILKRIGLLFLLVGLGLSLCVNVHLRQYGGNRISRASYDTVQTPFASVTLRGYPPTFLPQWLGSLHNDLKFIELTNKLPESYNLMLGLTGRCDDQLKSAIFYNLSFADLANMEIGKCISNLQTALEYNSDNTEARYNWELLAQQREESGSNGIPREGEGDKLFREKEQDRSGKYGIEEGKVGW